MSEVGERYAAIAEGFTTRVEGIDPDGWSGPTPCSDWTVRDLVAHVTMTHRRVTATATATVAVEVDHGADLISQWREATTAVTDALGDESRATTIVSGMFGEQTFESLVGRLVCADTLIHTWDLARATGQDETLVPLGVTRALETLTPLDEAIRRPGGFGPKIDPGPDADEQTRFLNFCGRSG
jgi:uncharacterized protein (TIGR03086 family)